MARTMPVIPESELSSILGAYDPDDCVWHCLAYASGCGDNYDDSYAYGMAIQYHIYMGISFDPTNYVFTGTGNQLNTFVSGYIYSGNYCPTHMFVFDPSKTSDWKGKSGALHAIIITDYNNGIYSYFDPSSDKSGTMSADDYNNSRKFDIYIQ